MFKDSSNETLWLQGKDKWKDEKGTPQIKNMKSGMKLGISDKVKVEISVIIMPHTIHKIQKEIQELKVIYWAPEWRDVTNQRGEEEQIRTPQDEGIPAFCEGQKNKTTTRVRHWATEKNADPEEEPQK